MGFLLQGRGRSGTSTRAQPLSVPPSSTPGSPSAAPLRRVWSTSRTASLRSSLHRSKRTAGGRGHFRSTCGPESESSQDGALGSLFPLSKSYHDGGRTVERRVSRCTVNKQTNKRTKQHSNNSWAAAGTGRHLFVKEDKKKKIAMSQNDVPSPALRRNFISV